MDDSSYELSINTINRPETLSMTGFFVEDFVFTDNGDLDKHNGRFCVTPDYPNGVYAYFATIDNVIVVLDHLKDLEVLNSIFDWK